MGYSNNRNVLPLTEKNNFYTDGCGRNYESKYYVNGAYIDLCGLTPEEYMNNPCCGGNSNSGSNSGKAKNNIQIISYEENGVIYYQAIADYPVTVHAVSGYSGAGKKGIAQSILYEAFDIVKENNIDIKNKKTSLHLFIYLYFSRLNFCYFL